jgi:hypothetical protein
VKVCRYCYSINKDENEVCQCGGVFDYEDLIPSWDSIIPYYEKLEDD